ncbi:DUF4253 domain-containing protein [Paenibacillus agricola]|uniref:DUF4253 domain-containing protein n=1 Tax=Paenibacillus agricola TaxID=2716264 RepID=A0ABX0J7F1_9BACL|nr:DUF4253 domain-containing protein [Paenibacillus agricola]NHN31548.1 DUF4253 domain-containing protein [Paenibacillus agricola]
MWILMGVLVGIIIVKWLNSRERKKKLERERNQSPAPQEPYRWTPPVAQPQEPLPLELGDATMEAKEAMELGDTTLEAREPLELAGKAPQAKEALELTGTKPEAGQVRDSTEPLEIRVLTDLSAEAEIYKLQTIEEARAELQRVSGQAALNYSTYDFGRERNPHCVSVIAPDVTIAIQWVHHMQSVLAQGLVCYAGTREWYGEDKQTGAEVVVGAGKTQFDIVRLARTDACNYDMDNKAIVAKLEQIHMRYGISIKAASSDTVGFAMDVLPKDLQGFCQELYGFCPDIVDQGSGSLAALEEQLEMLQYVELWWD